MIRFFDIVISLAGLLLLLPLFLLIFFIVIIGSRGGAFYLQTRVGKDNRDFRLVKFRTMRSGAEKSGGLTIGARDSRITGAGYLLRKYKLDELPQLINVLKGEMSLVGPRPLPVYEVEKFERAAHRRRLSMKPGLTCLWQIRGRNKVTDFREWVRMDLEYIDNWSIFMDLYILIRTIPVVLAGSGAK